MFSKAELDRLGVSRSELRRHVHDGALVRLRRGWYVRSCEYDAELAARIRHSGMLGRWTGLLERRAPARPVSRTASNSSQWSS
ncbi:MAG: type IV toxin-antitoxin system AbiEi family antitoxin domain-containing protein [Gordonia sp. (in: high G+C Gram-positive bacteria)]